MGASPGIKPPAGYVLEPPSGSVVPPPGYTLETEPPSDLSAGSGGNPVGDFVRGVWHTTGAGVGNAVRMLQGGLSGNPLPMIEAMPSAYDAQKQQFQKAKGAFERGSPIEGSGYTAAGLLPLVGPAAAHAGELIGSGDTATGMGEATGLIAPFAMSATKAGVAKATAPIQDSLREGASTDYSRAFAPTTKANKALTQKIVEGTPGIPGQLPPTPGMIERGVTAFTRGGLRDKISGMVDDLGNQIDEAQSRIPYGTTKIPYEDVVKSINKGLNKRFAISTPGYEGEALSAGPDADRGMRVGLRLKKTIAAAVETDPESGKLVVDYQLLRTFKQNWDASIAESGGFANKDFVNNAKMGAYKSAANGIRNELNKATPDIAAINREFHFWKNAQDVIEATVDRTRGQSQPLGQQIMQGAGAAAGIATGGATKAAEIAMALKNVRKLTTSTAWNTFGAVAKDRLANALASGDSKLVNAIILAQPGLQKSASLPPPPAQ